METSKRSEIVVLIHGKALVHIHGNTDLDGVVQPSNDRIMQNVLLIAGGLETLTTAVSQQVCWCNIHIGDEFVGTPTGQTKPTFSCHTKCSTLINLFTISKSLVIYNVLIVQKNNIFYIVEVI